MRKFLLLFLVLILLTSCGETAATTIPTSTVIPTTTSSNAANSTVGVVTTKATTSQIQAEGCLPVVTTNESIVQACVNEPTPKQQAKVTVFARLIIDGKAVPGIAMDTTWSYKFLPSGCKGVSEANGVASCTKDIGNATKDFKVVIEVKFTYQGKTYNGATDFTTEPTTVQTKTTAAIVPTQLPAPTLEPTVVPTPTPIVTIAFTGYAVIKANSEILDNPSPDGKVLEQVKNDGLVAWQNKTSDGKYFERLGGGWVKASDITNYKSQGEALMAIAPTPAPPTPKPTATLPVVINSLGIPRATFVKKFTTLGFVFHEGAPNKGQPNILGNHPQGNTIQLIGPENDVIECSVTLIVSTNKTVQTRAITHVDSFIAIVLPGTPALQWFVDNLIASLKQPVTTTYGNKLVTLNSIAATDGSIVIFSVEAK